MYRKILVAYDGSTSGLEALKQGADLACLCRAKIHLLAIVDLVDAGLVVEGMTFVSDGEQARIERVLQQGVDWLKRRGLHASADLKVGNPAAEIDAMARNIRADLIVLGHRSRSALERWLAGSVGISVLNHAPCSLLVAVESPIGEPDHGRSNTLPRRGKRPYLYAVSG